MDGLKLEFHEYIKYVLLLSCGGVLGSNTRFFLFQSLGKIFTNKGLEIFFINNLSSFLLGLISAILANNSSLKYSYELGLLIVIGFLGGLSTFSTFIYDLFELYLNSEFSKLFTSFLLSISFGLIFLSIGFVLGN